MCFTHMRRKNCLSLVSDSRTKVILRDAKHKTSGKHYIEHKQNMGYRLCVSVGLLTMLWILLSMETSTF